MLIKKIILVALLTFSVSFILTLQLDTVANSKTFSGCGTGTECYSVPDGCGEGIGCQRTYCENMDCPGGVSLEPNEYCFYCVNPD